MDCSKTPARFLIRTFLLYISKLRLLIVWPASLHSGSSSDPEGCSSSVEVWSLPPVVVEWGTEDSWSAFIRNRSRTVQTWLYWPNLRTFQNWRAFLKTVAYSNSSRSISQQPDLVQTRAKARNAHYICPISEWSILISRVSVRPV